MMRFVLTGVDRCCFVLAGADLCWQGLLCVDRCWSVLTGADLCWQVLFYVDRCWSVLTGVNLCWQGYDLCWQGLFCVGRCWTKWWQPYLKSRAYLESCTTLRPSRLAPRNGSKQHILYSHWSRLCANGFKATEFSQVEDNQYEILLPSPQKPRKWDGIWVMMMTTTMKLKCEWVMMMTTVKWECERVTTSNRINVLPLSHCPGAFVGRGEDWTSDLSACSSLLYQESYHAPLLLFLGQVAGRTFDVWNM
jgi:hypothetical protein